MPPVRALDQLRAANGDQGIVERARSNPRLLVGIGAGALLLLTWIGWAIYVASSNGTTAGLGVVIAWPAMLAALALISLPFIGGYLLIRRLAPSERDEPTATVEAEADSGDEESEEDTDSDEEAPSDQANDKDDSEDEPEDESETDPEAKAAKS